MATFAGNTIFLTENMKPLPAWGAQNIRPDTKMWPAQTEITGSMPPKRQFNQLKSKSIRFFDFVYASCER